MTQSSGDGADAAFDVAAAQAPLDEVTAPWVRDLGLRVVEIKPSCSRFHLPFGEALTRESGLAPADAAVFVYAGGGHESFATLCMQN